jgi:hypothetical protein
VTGQGATHLGKLLFVTAPRVLQVVGVVCKCALAELAAVRSVSGVDVVMLLREKNICIKYRAALSWSIVTFSLLLDKKPFPQTLHLHGLSAL